MAEPHSDTQFSLAVQEHDLEIMKEEARNGVKRLNEEGTWHLWDCA